MTDCIKDWELYRINNARKKHATLCDKMLHVLYIIYIGGVLENFRAKLKKIYIFLSMKKGLFQKRVPMWVNFNNLEKAYTLGMLVV